MANWVAKSEAASEGADRNRPAAASTYRCRSSGSAHSTWGEQKGCGVGGLGPGRVASLACDVHPGIHFVVHSSAAAPAVINKPSTKRDQTQRTCSTLFM